MEKTYKILTDTEIMPSEEIYKMYAGCWVYIANAETRDGKLVKGRPVVISSETPYDGAEDGIYDKFNNKQYGRCLDRNLFNNNFVSVWWVYK